MSSAVRSKVDVVFGAMTIGKAGEGLYGIIIQ
jgi:hypothetical protein